MAVDTRPYKSKEQDGNGNEIIIRDQQLVEQSSQTTMASGEYFEIVDVDGRMAKIPKDNMIGVVREALGSLLNGLADQTTVAKFLTLNGNTLGASAAATAASVLGGLYAYGDTLGNTDIDTLYTKNGSWIVGQSNPSANKPSGQTNGIIAVNLVGWAGMCTQYWTGINTSGVFCRYRSTSSTWTAWQRCDNFGCNTASDLASLLGGLLLHRKWAVKADNVEHTIDTGYVGYFIVKIVNESWATLFRKSYGTIVKVEGTDLDSSHITVTATANQIGIIVKANSNSGNNDIIIIEVG